ncbi:DNA polymerase IV [Sediminispirochaeta smaragdinae]|uniref:DNA polymerase IV n=1 Tax=Sediminispirochaeta smaragdinae (strain DSM 11293 / JCM 15392 / SEBR 4228) TaxID=573413 RepID=E1R3N0_SEDSS|nr:DNA polymerase IV [Sediminispirochaeta smaragdinae]ADK82001.1 DNA-directed DNA polymerase [Sediminispirochaeta smaragdinae DSM 11293]
MSRRCEPIFFHVDMDAFYASVEQADKPELKGKPVVIGAAPGGRGVVSACSYEARRFGVHSAMPISEAYRRCPKAHYLPVRMKRYQEVSRTIMALFSRFTPEIQQISVDEAFLNLTGTERLFGPPEVVARSIKELVRETTDLTISIGIAQNRFLAKLASEAGKPDGLVRILPGDEEAFIDTLSLRELWGLGKKTMERLNDLNIRSVKELRSLSEQNLKRLLGDGTGAFLYRACRGIDPGIFTDEPKSRSISNETTFPHDTHDNELIHTVLLDLSHQVFFRLLSEKGKAYTAFIKVRFSDFKTTTAQKTLKRSLSSAEELFELAQQLLQWRWDGTSDIRLIGIGVSGLSEHGANQSDLFEDPWERKKQVEEAVLNIRKKGNKIIKARFLRPGKVQDDDRENH